MYRKSEEAKHKERINKLLNNGMQFVMLDPLGNFVKPYRQTMLQCESQDTHILSYPSIRCFNLNENITLAHRE